MSDNVKSLFLNVFKMTLNQNLMGSRYSDKELLEFKLLFEHKLAIAQRELKQLEDLLADENDELKKEQIVQMLQRHFELIEYIKKSLIRIETQSFGVCEKTGTLIDRENLLAVPHGKIKRDF